MQLLPAAVAEAVRKRLDRGLPILARRKVSAVAKKERRKQGWTSTRKPAAAAIDRDKLRAAVRRLGEEYVFYMLDDALDFPAAGQAGEARQRASWT
jgi:hypothetical protein